MLSGWSNSWIFSIYVEAFIKSLSCSLVLKISFAQKIFFFTLPGKYFPLQHSFVYLQFTKYGLVLIWLTANKFGEDVFPYVILNNWNLSNSSLSLTLETCILTQILKYLSQQKITWFEQQWRPRETPKNCFFFAFFFFALQTYTRNTWHLNPGFVVVIQDAELEDCNPRFGRPILVTKTGTFLINWNKLNYDRLNCL